MKLREGIFPELIKPKPSPQIHTEREASVGFRRRIWNLLEDPNSSGAAWAFGMFSMSVVTCSVVTACVETMSTGMIFRLCKKHEPDLHETNVSIIFMQAGLAQIFPCQSFW